MTWWAHLIWSLIRTEINTFNAYGNLITALATVILVWFAYYQLKKMHFSNSLNILFNLENELNSDEMTQAQRKLYKELKPFLSGKKSLDKISEEEWTKIQSMVEKVIDYFEKIGFLVNKNEFELDTIYQMYSHYIQGYWELCDKIGYFKKVRFAFAGGGDFYDQFESLYKAIIKKYNLIPFSDEELMKFCEYTSSPE